ncbi:MAG TPA: hypothetical protein VLS92_10300 [Acidimicrobiia bacterium]|nr:hypothetical protein [Acidimicrobiia bacterium]
MPAEAPPAGTDGTAPLLILGGHRCGTSLVSGLLWQAGLQMGTLLPAGPDNPRGFFESVDVLAAHEAILATQERDWTCPPHRLDLNTIDLEPLAAVIDGLAGAGRPWGVKDPRLLFLLPAWAQILPAMRLIGVLRHPAAAAASLESRNGFSPRVARAIADAHQGRLAFLHAHLGFPIVDYDGPRPLLLDRVRAVAEAMGLAWEREGAEELFDPGLRHQRPEGPGGSEYEALVAAGTQEAPCLVHQSWEVAAALAAIPERDGEATPLVVGPAFPPRRDALWEFISTRGPTVGRVLDIVPEEGRREPLLHGVDRVEIDFACSDREGVVRDARPSVRYSHSVLTGVAETLPTAALAGLLAGLRDTSSTDAIVGLDALVVDEAGIPPVKRWPRLSATSARRGPLHHHHLDEIEVAALEADGLVGDISPGPAGRSRILLVKDPGRRAPDWLTSTERRAALTRQGHRITDLQKQARLLDAEVLALRERLDRERRRNHLAYDALLMENADIRHLYGQMREEVRRLRGLRTIRGWLAFQVRRLRPGHVAAAVRRRRNPPG